MAPASARIAATRTSLELAGDIGKHSQSQRNYEQNLAEMTPEELSAIIDKWEVKRLQLQRTLPLFDKGLCTLTSVIVHIKTVFYLSPSGRTPHPPAIPQKVQTL